MEKGIITIARQYGSQGRAVGEKLAKRLGIPLYGKEEMSRMAKSRDYEEVRAFYEEQPVNSLLYAIARRNMEQDMGKIPFRRIRELCEKEPCVLIGRCGNYIFREEPCAVSIFIHGKEENKIAYVEQLEGIGREAAKRRIRQVDEDRASFHKFYTQREWGRAEDYELCLDTSVLGVDQTVEVIMDYLKRRGLLTDNV